MEATDDRLEGLKDLLGQAIVLKTDGNAAYSSKDYQTAIRKYHRAIMLLKAVVQTKTVESELLGTQDGKELPKEMVDQRDQLISECYNNLAGILLLLVINYTNSHYTDLQLWKKCRRHERLHTRTSMKVMCIYVVSHVHTVSQLCV